MAVLFVVSVVHPCHWYHDALFIRTPRRGPHHLVGWSAGALAIAGISTRVSCTGQIRRSVAQQYSLAPSACSMHAAVLEGLGGVASPASNNRHESTIRHYYIQFYVAHSIQQSKGGETNGCPNSAQW